MSATAPHASARCEPDTATRCDSPSTLNSSSARVPIRRRRSPSTMPSSRSPPTPGTSAIRSSIDARSASSAPDTPGRQAPTSARHAEPVPHAPERAVRRAHDSSAGSGFRIAENRTVRPNSGTGESWGHRTRTRAPSRTPPAIRARTVVPKAPGIGSASTIAVHSRAPLSATSEHWRSQASPCRHDTTAPARRPATTSALAGLMGRLAGRTSQSAAQSASHARTAGSYRPPVQRVQETRSPATQPAQNATLNHAMAGTDGRGGSPLTRPSPGPSSLRTSSARSPARASGPRAW